MEAIKLNNSSDFWYYHDEYELGTWSFAKIRNADFIDLNLFIKTYISITEKYRILLPTSKNKEFKSISDLYTIEEGGTKKSIYKSLVFLKKRDEIVAEELFDLRQIKHETDEIEDLGINPVISNLSIANSSAISLPGSYISVNTDGFKEVLDFNKDDYTLYDEKVDQNNIKKANISGIDNSDLMFLNTPRFNSFLRDLKKLYSIFNSEIVINKNNTQINENGIFIGNEIVYYEDILELIDAKYQIVDMSINIDFEELKNQFNHEKRKERIETLKSEDKLIKEFLEANYKNLSILSWEQFYNSFVKEAFTMSDDDYLKHLKEVRCPFGFIGRASEAKKIYENLKDIEFFEEDVKKVISVITSGDFLKNKNLSLMEWLNDKFMIDFISKKIEGKSILDIAKFEGGNNFIREKIIEMKIFKLF
ncbi:hypothetical protein [Tenacibaculum sp.]|uniref:hypothetical protein n=1 Tax=Tenacibaculum sp. TaxID=1906242 RepID=UPI003D0D121E